MSSWLSPPEVLRQNELGLFWSHELSNIVYFSVSPRACSDICLRRNDFGFADILTRNVQTPRPGTESRSVWLELTVCARCVQSLDLIDTGVCTILCS